VPNQDQITKLYTHIVQSLVLEDSLTDIDLNAAAVEDGVSIQADRDEVTQREIAQAQQMQIPFSQGLVQAWGVKDAGNEIALSDQDPAQNAIADAMIQYLVSYDLAESSAEPQQPTGYLYKVSVAWDQLEPVAQAAGVDLAAALA